MLRFHDERIENRYFGCKPRIARFTEVAGYKPGFWSKDPRMERERQRQHNSNSRAAIRYAVPAPHPSWQAEPWKKVQQVDLTPRPMHPDAHADRMKQQQAERHKQSEDEREQRKHNPAMVKDAAHEATSRPHDSSDGQKTAQQERKEKLMKLALANLETRGLDRGGGRTRDR